MIKRNIVVQVLSLIIVCSSVHGQTGDSENDKVHDWLFDRIQPAPESIFDKFQAAGMDPVDHKLSDTERELFLKSFSMLPKSYQSVLKEHLHSFSFMDNMPNTALTSTLDTTLYGNSFNITFRAGIFNETISEWATWKENMCYTASGDDTYRLHIEAGDMNAMVYVLLHEATHIMDVVISITPQNEVDGFFVATPFTRDVWSGRNIPENGFKDSLLETTRFRGGKPIAIQNAPKVYNALKDTPFVSLYGMASWSEDLAEILTIYHLTEVLDQPYRVVVSRNGKKVFRFEPMKNKLVKKRVDRLEILYKG